jgi:2-oxoglutarate ferredoxin oxidoreductase subunit gamma
MERYRIVFSGSGGQGVVTASIMVAEAAVLFEGLNAVQSQSYGPEARGGATRADVIISDRPIRFPKVNQPNVLICLTQEAYNRYSGSIRPGGLLLTDSHFVKPERKVDARQVGLGMYRAVMDAIGKPVVFNICTQVVTKKSILKVLETKIPAGFLEMNTKAFEIGQQLVENASGRSEA